MLEAMGARVETVMGSPFMRTPARARGPSPDELRYLRSYLRLRFFVGALGASLPFVLVAGEWIVAGAAQPSLSGYYYTVMRDVFVGVCVAIGVFLVFYMVAERNFDNYASTAAGVAVIVVGLVPTDDPASADDSPLRVAVHYLAAVVFILLLAAICFRFGWAERVRADGRGRAARLHFACAAAIVIALAFAGLSQWLGFLTGISILLAETASVLAFGASWLVKGAELFRTPRP